MKDDHRDVGKISYKRQSTIRRGGLTPYEIDDDDD